MERDLQADELARQAVQEGRIRPISQIVLEKMRESAASATPQKPTPETEAALDEMVRMNQEMGLYD